MGVTGVVGQGALIARNAPPRRHSGYAGAMSLHRRIEARPAAGTGLAQTFIGDDEESDLSTA